MTELRLPLTYTESSTFLSSPSLPCNERIFFIFKRTLSLEVDSSKSNRISGSISVDSAKGGIHVSASVTPTFSFSGENRSAKTSRSVFSAPPGISEDERWKEGLGDCHLPDNALITDFTDERTNEIAGWSSSRLSAGVVDIVRTKANTHAKRKNERLGQR